MDFHPLLQFRRRTPTEEEAIDKARDEYDWDWSWPPGCATLRSLPLIQMYRPDFIRHVAALTAELMANHVAQVVAVGDRKAPPPLPSTSADLLGRFFAAAEAFHEGAPRHRPDRPEHYCNYFASIPETPLITRYKSEPDCADALFAWHRVAGCNPMAIHRVTRLPDDFPLSEADWTSSVGAGTLAGALAEGKLFAVDFAMLQGVAATRYLGRQKYISGARGLFFAQDRKLRPVAVQPEPGGLVATPKDGYTWLMACYCLQVADANIHETMEHLGRTHMVMEAVGVAAHRQVGDAHPLRALLDPHLVGTFAVNASAKNNLIAPGGVIDRVFAARIDVAASLVRASLDTFVLQDAAPPSELRRRGVDDASVLDFPYRDDVLPIYAAIERFVRAYLALHYAGDAAVAADAELAAWVDELGSPIGGALKGIRPVKTVDDLTVWMSNIIHLASAQHSAVNFPQFPFYSWGATAAGACWGPPPTGKDTEADLLELMPPWDCLFLQADVVYELAGVYYTRLGDYTFEDPRAALVVKAFQDELAAIDTATAERDKGRLLTYPFLRPSVVPASINI